LEARVKELETSLKESVAKQSTLPLTPESDSGVACTARDDGEISRKWHWEGVWVTDGDPRDAQYYGPSSTMYYLTRMRQYFQQTFQGSESAEPLGLLNAANSDTYSGQTLLSKEHKVFAVSDEERLHRTSLSKSQEETLIGLFWQSHHCIVSILDDESFLDYHSSLWVSDTRREPSPLVDIVLAVALQYGFVCDNRALSSIDISKR
jgi:hypothetical protein